jgi:thioredoxin 1
MAIHTKKPLDWSRGAFEEEVLKADGPVLVVFWAEWCGPCRQISPLLDQIAGENAGRLTVAKVNIDTAPDVPRRYGVRGIPTLILFQDGQTVSTKLGSLPKRELVKWIDSVLGQSP